MGYSGAASPDLPDFSVGAQLDIRIRSLHVEQKDFSRTQEVNKCKRRHSVKKVIFPKSHFII